MERTTRTDERLDDLSHRMDEGFNRLDRRFDHIDSRFDQVDRRFGELTGQLDSIRLMMFRLSSGLLVALLGAIGAIAIRGA